MGPVGIWVLNQDCASAARLRLTVCSAPPCLFVCVLPLLLENDDTQAVLQVDTFFSHLFQKYPHWQQEFLMKVTTLLFLPYYYPSLNGIC